MSAQSILVVNPEGPPYAMSTVVRVYLYGDRKDEVQAIIVREVGSAVQNKFGDDLMILYSELALLNGIAHANECCWNWDKVNYVEQWS